MRRRELYSLAILLVIALVISVTMAGQIKAHEHPVADSHFPWREIDLLPVWLGAQAVLHHQNPYTAEFTSLIQRNFYGRTLTPVEGQTLNEMGYAYPAHLAIFIAPLTLLPWKLIPCLGLLTLSASIGASAFIWVWLLRLKLARQQEFLIAALIMVSWPAVWGLRVENLSLFVIPIIAAACLCLDRHRPIMAGCLLSIATTKPQLIVLLLPWLLLRSALRREWNFILSFAAITSLTVAIAAAFLPRWWTAWSDGVKAYNRYTHMQRELPVLPLAILAALAIAMLWRLRSEPIGIGVSLSLAAGYALIPANQATSYNLLLLTPAILYLLTTPQAYSMIPRSRLMLYAMAALYALLPLLLILAHFLQLPVLVTVAMLAQLYRRPAICSSSSTTASLPV